MQVENKTASHLKRQAPSLFINYEWMLTGKTRKAVDDDRNIVPIVAMLSMFQLFQINLLQILMQNFELCINIVFVCTLYAAYSIVTASH